MLQESDQLSEYQLSCELKSHESDVRTICTLENGMFVTGSRDRSLRIWAPKEGGFEVEKILLAHQHYVSAVLFVPADSVQPGSPWTVASGGHDKAVIVWDLATGAPARTLQGHTNTVSSLALLPRGAIPPLLASGAWDLSIRLWRLDSGECVRTVASAHTLPVRALLSLPQSGSDGDSVLLLLSGSSDRSIKLWRIAAHTLEFSVVRTYTGHEDVVMSLAALGSLGFVSASNDQSVRVWSFAGECLAQLHGHSSLVLGIAALCPADPSDALLVSGSDDLTVKLWRHTALLQTLRQPASVWAVAVQPNGDVLVACADAVVRVWTRTRARAASAALQAEYAAQLERRTIAPQQLGTSQINPERLPGPEYLQQNVGKRDGEHKLIRVGSEVEVHQWDQAKQQWVKLGVVTGAGGSSQSDDGGLVHGKRYDQVFRVELDDTGAARQLGYNRGENPYTAAQRFLWDEDLPQAYLDTVAQFIVRNTAPVELSVAAGSGAATQQSAVLLSDPLTGANRYTPTAAAASAPAPSTAAYFPNREVLAFDTGNLKALHGKLLEFNALLQQQPATAALSLRANTDAPLLDALLQHAAGTHPPLSADHFDLLRRLLQWPDAQRVPVLDLVRALLVPPTTAAAMLDAMAQWLPSVRESLRPQAGVTNQFVALRALVNLLRNPTAIDRLLSTNAGTTLSSVLEAAAELQSSSHKSVRMALASLLVNLAAYWLQRSTHDCKLQAVSLAVELLNATDHEPECAYRLVVASGTLVHQDEQCMALLRDLDPRTALQRYRTTADSPKLSAAVAQLLQKL